MNGRISRSSPTSFFPYLTLLLWLLFSVHAQGESPAIEPLRPQIVRQILLPSFAKEDWQASAFSEDSQLLLVVDEQRSFIVHTASGRELRPVKLEADQFLIWARARPATNNWIGVTNSGLVIGIRPETGESDLIYDFGALFHHRAYRRGDVSFDFNSDDRIIAYVSTPREKPISSGVYRYNDQALLSLDLRSVTKVALNPITTEQFFSNIEGRIVVNATSDSVALFEPRGGYALAFWHRRGDRTGINRADAYNLVCTDDRFLGQHIVNIRPHQTGFLIFMSDARVIFVDLADPSLTTCSETADASKPPMEADAGKQRRCNWQLAVSPRSVVAAGSGEAANVFWVVLDTLDLLRVEYLPTTAQSHHR